MGVLGGSVHLGRRFGALIFIRREEVAQPEAAELPAAQT